MLACASCPATASTTAPNARDASPGAHHLHYRELLHDDGTFRSPEALRALFASRGATPEKEIVAYCRLSHRATLLWFAARLLLRYPRVRSYDGSWTEWGSMVGMPVETE
jgi:thiosulfate/3-mercaptopyruvate sulfurtransferase